MQSGVATHGPPFADAAWHFDMNTRSHQPSDDQWQPYFVCQAVGDVLRAAAEKHPDRRMLVLAVTRAPAPAEGETQ